MITNKAAEARRAGAGRGKARDSLPLGYVMSLSEVAGKGSLYEQGGESDGRGAGT